MGWFGLTRSDPTRKTSLWRPGPSGQTGRPGTARQGLAPCRFSAVGSTARPGPARQAPACPNGRGNGRPGPARRAPNGSLPPPQRLSPHSTFHFTYKYPPFHPKYSPKSFYPSILPKLSSILLNSCLKLSFWCSKSEDSAGNLENWRTFGGISAQKTSNPLSLSRNLLRQSNPLSPSSFGFREFFLSSTSFWDFCLLASY